MAAPIWAETIESSTSAVGGTPRERAERRAAIGATVWQRDRDLSCQDGGRE